MNTLQNLSIKGHNPYFNRWFSAMNGIDGTIPLKGGHNPYFNRWFSAIKTSVFEYEDEEVTILILIDGFLQ